MTKRISIAIGVLLLAIAVIWWHAARETPQAGSAIAKPETTPTIPLPPRPRATPIAIAKPDGLSHDDPLTAYRKANVYPPTSRPLTKDNVDLLEPNKRQEQMRQTDADDGVMFLFTADRYYVIGDQTLTATLDVRRDGKAIPVTITKAFASVLDPVTHNEMPITLTFTPHNSVLAAVMAPATLGLPRQTAIGMYVEFQYGGGRQRDHFDFQYTPARGIPATFTGSFRDTVENGSLVIAAGIDVARGGDYLIDCNLFDANDQPVGWTRFKGSLASGGQEADLLFFGKVITDSGAHGPFHIGQLRGALYDPASDPDLEQMPSFSGTYATAAYTTDQFSIAEYDSPQKQKMIEFLIQQKQAGVMQAGATPADPGTPGTPGK